MYQLDRDSQPQRRRRDGPAPIPAETRARHALDRLDRVWNDDADDPSFAPARLRAALLVPLADPDLERRRVFAFARLAWLDGDVAAARDLLEAVTDAPAAYWLARVRLLLGDLDGLTAYERQMRTFQGSPQATCWFVDLLLRAGRHERAAQVWKSVRVNKRVAACEEASLLEARLLLASDDVAAAERALQEIPKNAVLKAERAMLLAWIESRRRPGCSLPETLVFPRRALDIWSAVLAKSATVTFETLTAASLSPPVRAFVSAQQARLHETSTRVVELLNDSVGIAALQPFVRYVRACLGEDDFSALLASLPGPFLAPRCRLWSTLSRFCIHRATTQEVLAAFKQAESAGCDLRPLSGMRRLVDLIDTHADLAEELRTSGNERNARRALVESLIARNADPTAQAMELAESDDLPLRQRCGKALLAESLRTGRPTDEVLSLAERLLGPGMPTTLVRDLRDASGETVSDTIREFLSLESAAPAARCLRTFEALRAGDSATARALLEPHPEWHSLPSPPRFLCRALATVPVTESRREAVKRWLAQWTEAGERTSELSQRLGLLPLSPADSVPPAGVDPISWRLHQASSALERDDPAAALAWIERVGPLSEDDPRRPIVEAALPELRRRTEAARLALTLRPEPDLPSPSPELVIDLAEQLREVDQPADLALKPGLPSRTAHHLALIDLRAALALERADRDEQAARHWQRSWNCWESWAASADTTDVALVFDHLLSLHGRRLRALLARNAVARARPLWDVLQSLSGGPLLRERLSRFHDDLADEQVVEAREAMRIGTPGVGMRADYEAGLARLRRLLSLNRDERRLLAALVEICVDWFLDLYDAREPVRLREEVERYAPFSLRLARLLGKPGEGWAEELTARTALSEFVKYRAFTTDDLDRKRSLYSEALALNPANDNVRELLDGMENAT